MNEMNVRTYRLVVLFCLLAIVSFGSDGLPSNDSAFCGPLNHFSTTSDVSSVENIKSRLNEIHGVVDMKFTKEVHTYIKNYVRSKKGTSLVLGRQYMYNPIFEAELIKHELPTNLKYLAIVESSLNPGAISKAGAAGLWQFMRGTGRMFGLTIDRVVDERRCPHKSTVAAVQYLKSLHNIFDDWALALAAYNSGPGRVKRAMKLSKSNDFWKLRRFLPKETRNYVPAFIAVNYLVNFYYVHGLEPLVENPEFLNVNSVTIYEKKTFKEISEITGISQNLLKSLNPAYLRNYIPANENGNYIRLPNKEAISLINHLYQQDLPLQPEIVSIYGDNTLVNHAKRTTYDLNNISVIDIKRIAPMQKANLPMDILTYRKEEYVYEVLSKRNSLYEIAHRNKLFLSDLMEWNNVSESHPPKLGQRIRVKQ